MRSIVEADKRGGHALAVHDDREGRVLLVKTEPAPAGGPERVPHEPANEEVVRDDKLMAVSVGWAGASPASASSASASRVSASEARKGGAGSLRSRRSLLRRVRADEGLVRRRQLPRIRV